MDSDVAAFTRGFVANLIVQNDSAIRPHAPEDRLGFQQVINVLAAEIQAMRDAGMPDRSWYKQVVRLKNELKPSNNGSFDGFEAAFRDLQLSFTGSPNPIPDSIQFEVSKPFAESTIKEIDKKQRDLIDRAVRAFRAARKGSLRSS